MTVFTCRGTVKTNHLNAAASQVLLCTYPTNRSGFEVPIEPLAVVVMLNGEESEARRAGSDIIPEAGKVEMSIDKMGYY